MELSKEYTHRYGKRHKSQAVIEWCITNLPNIPELGYMTEQPKAMPDECKTDGVVNSYRKYYMIEKRNIADWKVVNTPHWFI